MKIELIYKNKCGNGTILYTKEPVEFIEIIRQTSQYGPDKVTKVPVSKYELYVSAGGTVELELTKINANFIKYAIEAELFELVDDDQMEMVDAMLKSKGKKVKEEEEEEVKSEDVPKSPAKKGTVVTV